VDGERFYSKPGFANSRDPGSRPDLRLDIQLAEPATALFRVAQLVEFDCVGSTDIANMLKPSVDCALP
jgi:hypothetical protein